MDSRIWSYFLISKLTPSLFIYYSPYHFFKNIHSLVKLSITLPFPVLNISLQANWPLASTASWVSIQHPPIVPHKIPLTFHFALCLPFDVRGIYTHTYNHFLSSIVLTTTAFLDINFIKHILMLIIWQALCQDIKYRYCLITYSWEFPHNHAIS